MKIVVAVKAVAVLDDDFEIIEGSALDPDFLEWELNEWDACALESAVELCESEAGGEVVAVTVGGEEAEETLLACLAKGADRGLRVWDASLAAADPLAVARVLAAAVEREMPDLVLCGVQSSDAANGATGIALAGFLDLPHVAVVRRVDYDAASATATVERELEGGLGEVIRVHTPALLAIQTGINQPRYATLRAIKQAREKPLLVTGPDALGLDAAEIRSAAGSRRRLLAAPQRSERAETLGGSAAEVATRIAELIRERVG